MTLAEARQHIPLYLDGELPIEARAGFERALADSPELQVEVARWRRFNACLCRCTGTEIDPAMLNSLRSRVREGVAHRGRAGRWVIRIGVLTAVAAAVALFLFWRPELINRAQRATTPPGVADAGTFVVAPATLEKFWSGCGRGEHREFALPEETAAGARAFFKDRPFPVEAPDLSDRGFELRGACHCFPGGKQAAHIYYRQPQTGEVISIFSVASHVSVESVGECAPPCKGAHAYQEIAADGVSIVKWCDGTNSYVIVGDVPLDALRDIVRTTLNASASGA